MTPLQDETGAVAIIAAQGPLTGTLIDFWRMVWVKRVEIIVMCTRIIENNKVSSRAAPHSDRSPHPAQVRAVLARAAGLRA